jgi:hypothetical protein
MTATKYVTKDNWKHKEFSTGMLRDTNENKPRFDLLHPLWIPYQEQMLTRFAELLGRWAIKYAERNREKAETIEELNRFKESASRHFEQRLTWEQDEDHASAVWFNIMGAEMVKYKLLIKSLSNNK